MRNYPALTRSIGLASLTALAACNSPPIIDPMTAKTPTTPAAPMACSMLPQGFVARGIERNVSISAAESVPAGITVSGMAQPYPMPAHCKLTGKVGERVGVDGKPYAISFELRMPTNWQGRFLLQANGGNEGAVVPAFGNVVSAGATTNALMQGFAVLSSNGGHASLPPQTPGADGKP
ncbi:MAG: tannase/feruloyl esterase family alpha/beta hydrolase, partial [Burkholderiaceae bacterium]|nr:tannase/feruloyl esterase family alpha/beta hydrolase [Burkholderiaceae bacterium]